MKPDVIALTKHNKMEVKENASAFDNNNKWICGKYMMSTYNVKATYAMTVWTHDSEVALGSDGF